MNRRAFVRRMASGALAGMLGVELLRRAPEVVAHLEPRAIVAWIESTGEGFTSLGAAVNAVAPGDRIFLAPASFIDETVVVDEPIAFVSSPPPPEWA